MMVADTFPVSESYGPETVFKPGSKMFPLEEWCSFLQAERPRMEVRSAQIGKGRLFKVASTGHAIGLREKTNLTLLMPRRGHLSVETERGSFVAKQGEALLFGPNARRTTVIPDQSGLFECDCALAPSQSLDPIERLLQSDGEGAGTTALKHLVRALVAAAEEGGAPFRSEAARQAAGVLLVEMMNDLDSRDTSSDGAAADDGRGHAGPAELRLVRAAEDIMVSKLAEPLSVVDLAASLQVSARRLQQAFRAVREEPPLSVLNRLRLDEAYQRLSRPEAFSTVGSVAYSCGFGHLGRFALAFRARFGDTPSTILRSARGGGGG